MADRIDKYSSIVLTAAAVFFGGVIFRREFIARSSPTDASSTMLTSERVENWRELASNGLSFGPDGAPIVIVEFADLECPACKHFNARAKAVAASMHAEVRTVLIHFPLSFHRFAPAAAKALECANMAGSGSAFMEAAYAKQDSFGLKTWPSYAQDAGIEDTAAFGECLRMHTSFARLERGRKVGDSLGVHATPTLIVNGWRLSSSPNEEQLHDIFTALLAGNAPTGSTK